MKRILYVSVVLFTCAIVLTIGFLWAASLLLVEKPPQPADIGIVLAGHFGRAMYAADLYRERIIPQIWVSRPEREKALAQLDALGVPYPYQEEITRAVLLKKGVPSYNIEVVGEGAVSTIEEARAVASVLSRRPEIRSVLLITSRFHVRRAESVFQHVLGENSQVKVFSVGSPYDGFVVDRWWKDRDSARQVILEAAKLMLFWVSTEF